jgi:hypothetical protein
MVAEIEEEKPVLTEPIEYSGQKISFDFKKTLPLLLVIAGGLLIIAGGVSVYRRAMKGRETAQVEPTPTLAPVEEVQATPTPSINRADLKIQILNGSGVKGAAGEAASFLEEKGYEDIKTGNADAYDYEETVVQIKEDKKDFLDILRADLAENYTLAEETETLEADSSFDAMVILGAE